MKWEKRQSKINKSVPTTTTICKGHATHFVVQDLDKRSQTVGSARSVGNDLVLWLVSVEVDTTNEPRSEGNWRRKKKSQTLVVKI